MADPLAQVMLLPGVSAALKEADAAIAGVSLSAKRSTSKVADRVLTMAALAAAELDGDSDAVVAATVIDAIGSLPDLKTAPLQALAQLHAIAAVTEPAEERGRPRVDFAANQRLTALAEVALSDSSAIVVAAILHGELLSMIPFRTGNALVGLGMARAVLVQRGVDPLISLEIGLQDFGSRTVLEVLDQYQTGTKDGVTAWIALHAKAVVFASQFLSNAIAQSR